MAEPTATERAIAEGARISLPAGESFAADWKAAEAELRGSGAIASDDASPDGELDKTKTVERGADGKFRKSGEEPEKPKEGEQKPPAKKGVEGQVSAAERHALERQAKRDAKAAVAAREQQLAQREQQLALREQSIATMVKAREAFERGDYDGAAQAFGVKTWNEVNDVAARAFASPEYKRIRDLEKRDAEREAERQREREAQAVQARNAQEHKVLTDYRENLAKSLPQAEDATIAALAESDPNFVDAVFHRVVAAARKGDDLDPLDVAEEVVEEARAHFERISKVFGGRPTSQAEATRVAPPDRAGRTQQPVKPQKHVSRSQAAEVRAEPEFETDAEWREWSARALKRAIAEDEAAGRLNSL